MEIVMIAGGIIAVVTTVIIAARYSEKKRTKALQALAASLKFSFSKKASDSFLPSLSQFHLFSQGHSKKASNVMNGRANEIDVSIFDYRYTTGSGKNSHTWRQTIALFKSSTLHLPRFTLRPENLFHKIGSAFGYQDIDFDSHPAFSKQYLLRAADEQACRDVFTDNILGYYDQRKGLSTECDGEALLFHRVSKQVRPSDIRSFFEEGFGIFSLFKSEA
jgi:hypothetical protein